MHHERPASVTLPSGPERDHRFAVHLMEQLVVPTFVLDVGGRVVIWNKACERLTGMAACDMIGTTNHWMAFYPEQHPCLADLVIGNFIAEIWDNYRDFSKFELHDHGIAIENWCDLRHAGRRAYLAIDAGPIYDETGSVVAVVETLRDITALRQAQDALETLAACDGLTGLANRRSFDQALGVETQRSARTGAPLSLLMMDIDGFKPFNDTYGHGEGDECLKRVAQTVARVVRRAGDVVARYGGEEFAVILPDTDAAGAASIADRIRCAVAGLDIEHGAAPVGNTVTISVGGATVLGAEPDAAGLLAAADSALYRAKREGRNRSVIAAGPVPPFSSPASMTPLGVA